MKNKKKGFTLVELLVVIAILAVLASVSVVGYLSFTTKAKQSADETAVTQMNTVLEATSVTNKCNSILEVYEVLNEHGLKAENYQTLSSGTNFYWYKTDNKIVIMDENSKEIIYPESLKNTNYIIGSLFSLTGKITKDDSYVKLNDSAGKISSVSVTSGNQFYAFVEDIEKNTNNYSNTLNVMISNDIDLMGSTNARLDLSNLKVKDIVISGPSGVRSTPTIHGLVNSQNLYAAPDSEGNIFNYGAGLISQISNQNVTFRNINFNNIESKIFNSGLAAGGLIGEVKGTNTNVTFENVHITNADVYAQQFVGGFIGRVLCQGDNKEPHTEQIKISFNNCSIKNSTIAGGLGQNAGLIGSINELCDFTLEEKANPTLAFNRVKSLLTITNTIVDNTVKLPIIGDGIETLDMVLEENTTLEHINCENDSSLSDAKAESKSAYTIKNAISLKGGLFLYGDGVYRLFATAKLFNINPTFRHDTGTSYGIKDITHNGKLLKINNALVPFNTMDDFNSIQFDYLEKPLTA